MSSEMAHEGIGISMLAMGQATTAPSLTQEVHLSLTLSLDTCLDNLNTTNLY